MLAIPIGYWVAGWGAGVKLYYRFEVGKKYGMGEAAGSVFGVSRGSVFGAFWEIRQRQTQTQTDTDTDRHRHSRDTGTLETQAHTERHRKNPTRSHILEQPW